MLILDRTENSYNQNKFLKFIFTSSDVVQILKQVSNKRHLFLYNLTFRKTWNLVRAFIHFVTGKLAPAFPPFFKIETTIVCQLSCPTCPHGIVGEHKIKRNRVTGSMDFALFTSIIDEIKRHSIVVSLYNLGEPLLTHNFLEMIEYTHSAGLGAYFTTNLSLKLTDEMIERLVESGLTLLVVAMDGFSQETYGQTRVGGDFARVRDNLARICRVKAAKGLAFPKIQVQSLIFAHNTHEKQSVIDFCRELQVDELRFDFGSTQVDPGAPRTHPTRRRFVPKCLWPYFSTIIRFNGDMQPCCQKGNEDHLVEGAEPLVVGNVARTPVRELFASPAMRDIRALTRDPSRADELKDTFARYCLNCCILFD